MSVSCVGGACCLTHHPDQSTHTHSAFCVMVPSATDAIDARAFANAVGVLTFLASVVMYTKSFCVLWGLRRM